MAPSQEQPYHIAVFVQCQLARQELGRRLVPDAEEQARHWQVADLQIASHQNVSDR